MLEEIFEDAPAITYISIVINILCFFVIHSFRKSYSEQYEKISYYEKNIDSIISGQEKLNKEKEKELKTEKELLDFRVAKQEEYYNERADKLNTEKINLKKEKDEITLKYKELSEEKKNYQNIINEELKKQNEELEKKAALLLSTKLKNIDIGLVKLCSEKSESMPWAADMFADFCTASLFDEADDLLRSRRKLDRERGVKITVLSKKVRDLTKELKALQYEKAYVQYMLPASKDYYEFDSMYTAPDDDDSSYLSQEEYDRLSDIEKNQLVLDRYKERHNKSKWEIGRNFEMYTGYLLSQKHYQVTYYGIDNGLNDLGRDLIAENDKQIVIVQCKYWSQNKTIHENYICQLFGTAYQYKKETGTAKTVIPYFFCHTELSDTAKKFADDFGIKYEENVELGDFPMIKCCPDSGIYHLPVDQQYDKLKKYVPVFTVEQAVKLGCRRAFRWHSQ